MKNEISPTIIQTEEKLVAAKKNKAAPPKIRTLLYGKISRPSTNFAISQNTKEKIMPIEKRSPLPTGSESVVAGIKKKGNRKITEEKIIKEMRSSMFVLII